jgi:glycosyltransferase involved in cell wall biosynthesis
MQVTAIVPMFNGSRFIAQAIASIRSQTVPPNEIIVVDDGSTDAGPALVESMPGVTLLRKPHTGIGDTVNMGVAAAHGDLIAFLDADDRWLPEKTALQIAALSRDSGLAVVFGHGRRFLDTGSDERIVDIRAAVVRGAGLFHRQALEQAGPFGTGPHHEFMTWLLAAVDAGLRHAILPDVVYERRIHDANHGLTCKADQRKTYFITLKAALDRRRLKQRS